MCLCLGTDSGLTKVKSPLQLQSPPRVLSSTSTVSSHSKNKPRYRTKAQSSEVDESLFGGVKVLSP